MAHLIKKQVFDFRVSSAVDVIALQQSISDRFATDLIPEMEKLFDGFSEENAILEIDKLEIDLGFITENDIDSGNWAELFISRLEEALKEVNIYSESGSSGKKTTASENAFRQWIFFIERGFLPWNNHKPSSDWLLQVLEYMATNYAAVEETRKLLLKHLFHVKRIVSEHEADFLQHLVEVLTSVNQHQLSEIIEAVAGKLSRKRRSRFILAKESIDRLKKSIWIKVLTDGALHRKESVFITSLKMLFKKDQLRTTSSEAMKTVLENLKLETGAGKAEAEQKPPMGANLQQATVMDDSIEPQERIEKAADEIFITNSGLVLVHPFLNTCFKNLDFVKDGTFTGIAARQRAVCLVHYLVASDQLHPEYELVLPKLLCGWPLHQPLDSQVDLTVDEKKEAADLLQHLINQWQILKNTSIEALQLNFLQREGKLEWNNERWNLIIESNSLDVLLEQLPWTVSYIKLPWMSNLLIVNWR